MKRWALLTFAAALAACQTAPPLAQDMPLKAYKKEVIRRMSTVWNRVAYERRDSLSPGTTKIRFKVLADGHVSELKVISNSGNDALADVARRTIEETSIPPIPRTALTELRGGYMPGDCSFTTYYTR